MSQPLKTHCDISLKDLSWWYEARIDHLTPNFQMVTYNNANMIARYTKWVANNAKTRYLWVHIPNASKIRHIQGQRASQALKMGEQVGEAVSYGKMRDFTVLSISNIYLKGLKSTLSFFWDFMNLALILLQLGLDYAGLNSGNRKRKPIFHGVSLCFAGNIPRFGWQSHSLMEFLGFGSFNLWVGPISKVRIDVAGIPVIRRGPPVSDGWWFHRHCFGDLVEICLWMMKN